MRNIQSRTSARSKERQNEFERGQLHTSKEKRTGRQDHPPRSRTHRRLSALYDGLGAETWRIKHTCAPPRTHRAPVCALACPYFCDGAPLRHNGEQPDRDAPASDLAGATEYKPIPVPCAQCSCSPHRLPLGPLWCHQRNSCSDLPCSNTDHDSHDTTLTSRRASICA